MLTAAAIALGATSMSDVALLRHLAPTGIGAAISLLNDGFATVRASRKP